MDSQNNLSSLPAAGIILSSGRKLDEFRLIVRKILFGSKTEQEAKDRIKEEIDTADFPACPENTDNEPEVKFEPNGRRNVILAVKLHEHSSYLLEIDSTTEERY